MEGLRHVNKIQAIAQHWEEPVGTVTIDSPGNWIELPKASEPGAIETRWAEYWIREKLFSEPTPAPGETRPLFVLRVESIESDPRRCVDFEMCVARGVRGCAHGLCGASKVGAWVVNECSRRFQRLALFTLGL